jgi:hypothetical protein
MRGKGSSSEIGNALIMVMLIDSHWDGSWHRSSESSSRSSVRSPVVLQIMVETVPQSGRIPFTLSACTHELATSPQDRINAITGQPLSHKRSDVTQIRLDVSPCVLKRQR